MEKTKKQLILDLFEQASMTELTEREARIIQKTLIDQLGEAGHTSRHYIASVLADAGKPVRIRDDFGLPVMEPEYQAAFEGVLKFDTLEHAEQSLRTIGELYHQFKHRGDAKGTAYARQMASLGKRRAQAAARRAKSPAARQVKSEIAEWFTLWLYAPDTFETWLSLRKQAPGFRQKFGADRSQVEEQ
jgi:hypothetical protein